MAVFSLALVSDVLTFRVLGLRLGIRRVLELGFRVLELEFKGKS